jgi:nitronate monooxygenase
METRLTRLLGMALPIVQAPMAGSQGSELALAVCAAGGLGSLPAATLAPATLHAELVRLQAQARGPYNVNFFCHAPPPHEPAREARWQQLLAPLYEEMKLPMPEGPAVAARTPFTAEVADLLEAFKPPVVSFHFGLPSPALVDRLKGWGSKIMSSATTLEEALWLQEHGADVVIAQGLEAGGHRGMFLSHDLGTQVGTLALVQQLRDRLQVPVVAAGGVADASGVAAARALGADGVQVGTAYLLCPEAATLPVHRAALRSARVHNTALTNLFTGRPARGVVNRFMRELGEHSVGMNPHAPAFPLATTHMAPLRSHAEAQGSGEFSPLWAGQNAARSAALHASYAQRAQPDTQIRADAAQTGMPAGQLTRLLATGWA